MLFSRRTRLCSIATMTAAPAVGDPPFRLHTSASSSLTTGEDEEPWSPIICDPPFAFINKNSCGTPTYIEHCVPKSQRSTRLFTTMKALADSNHSSCPTTPSFSSILPDDDDVPFSPIICNCTFAFCIKDSRGNCSAAARHHATTQSAHRPAFALVKHSMILPLMTYDLCKSKTKQRTAQHSYASDTMLFLPLPCPLPDWPPPCCPSRIYITLVKGGKYWVSGSGKVWFLAGSVRRQKYANYFPM